MSVFINRILNMKKIKAIGFDMDYTLVRYHTENFERLAHQEALKKLVSVYGYPSEISALNFDPLLVIQGLILDKKQGNLLKISRFGKVKTAYHGTTPLEFKKQQDIYSNRVIDLNDENFQSLDTNFSVSQGVLFAQLVDMKDKGLALPDFTSIADDVKNAVDLAHRDGSLKDQVKARIDEFIIKDPGVAKLLERFKRYGKKLWVITNSDYNYTKLLLDYTITPFLKEHKDWTEVFDIVITFSKKPRFFYEGSSYLSIDPKSGHMQNFDSPVVNGIYQGGNAKKLQEDLGLEGEEILYLGDHIYGDVVTLKKTFNWRTALVLDPLKEEVEGVIKSDETQRKIDDMMIKKSELEKKLNDLEMRKYEQGENIDKEEINRLFAEIERANTEIGSLLDSYRTFFNPHWGEMMRAGSEESRFADQVEKYACIYMAKVTDLLDFSPRTYFRPHRRIMPHEILE